MAPVPLPGPLRLRRHGPHRTRPAAQALLGRSLATERRRIVAPLGPEPAAVLALALAAPLLGPQRSAPQRALSASGAEHEPSVESDSGPGAVRGPELRFDAPELPLGQFLAA